MSPSEDRPTNPSIKFVGEPNGNGNQPPRPRRRRTPSAPMAALTPEEYEPRPPPGQSMVLEPRTRDELILKLIARVERIDTESELLVEAIQAQAEHAESNTAMLNVLRHDQGVLIDEVRELTNLVGTMMELLRSVPLGELDDVVGEPPRADQHQPQAHVPTMTPQRYAAGFPSQQPNDREDEG